MVMQSREFKTYLFDLYLWSLIINGTLVCMYYAFPFASAEIRTEKCLRSTTDEGVWVLSGRHG